MIDFSTRPILSDDGKTHINTHGKSATRLGRLLSPGFNVGEPIHHPLLGHFRTVENLWCYLNTGGARDNIRNMEPKAARNFARLAPQKYSCDKFRDLTIDATFLKLKINSSYEELMISNHLPFDHYYVVGEDRLPIRPTLYSMYISALNDVRDILRGEKEHEFVRISEMSFRPIS